MQKHKTLFAVTVILWQAYFLFLIFLSGENISFFPTGVNAGMYSNAVKESIFANWQAPEHYDLILWFVLLFCGIFTFVFMSGLYWHTRDVFTGITRKTLIAVRLGTVAAICLWRLVIYLSNTEYFFFLDWIGTEILSISILLLFLLDRKQAAQGR